VKDKKKYIYVMFAVLIIQLFIAYRQQTLITQVEWTKESTMRILHALENLWLK